MEVRLVGGSHLNSSHTILYQGLLDKKPGTPAWTEPMFIKQAICFVLNMVFHVLQKYFKMNDRQGQSSWILLHDGS